VAKKKTTTFECQACGFLSGRWLGKCPNCGAWDNFVELSETQKEHLKNISTQSSAKSFAVPITDIEEENVERFSTDDSELDLVLGGGVVPGALTLIGGSPGVGKSTLLLKISSNLAKSGKKVLYVSGEESLGQIKIRANRLDANSQNLHLLAEIKLENVTYELEKGDYDVCIIDSIQTMYSEGISSAPGSVSQVREVTFALMRFAKEKECAIFIIGHITKEGSIAGPRILEHMVDTVLYFEGDSSKELRILRGFKNRFGSTSEIGIFEMTAEGLVSSKDITNKFLSNKDPKSGSALTVTMEGSRPILLEVQALVADSTGANPKRSSTGYELNRLNMILALLERKLELPFNRYDVFINITGGIKITETAVDLAVVAAIISSFRDRPISKETVFVGEVSLVGDIREVFAIDARLNEAKSMGMIKAIIPKNKNIQDHKIKLYQVDEVVKVIDWM
jgi:DNA repair protein RadA/Sms